MTFGIAVFDAVVLPKNLGEGEMSKAVNDEQVNDLPSLGKLTKNKVSSDVARTRSRTTSSA